MWKVLGSDLSPQTVYPDRFIEEHKYGGTVSNSKFH
jgi:hypothetical protein